ncbi:thermonuclease family protein [Aurantimonas sp. C2-6-R+9]|uniref:thermonuclease family protein n=1 Tax=unclassified Aurantimonas TaxID=2638230 RepID=UPI002E18F731|nr:MULTISPECIES: thermonuclease family protein [unclassified Aurantimonas]MEC5292445.1 thermonuclease family protein [Aurantimonas sp. C2-3-R2]MEC5382619.1 thermonuclease family protein [Aurantimonas sp. C2-6-R+9]MEC5413623.1 thermonuclease family protein [Aurantimonas sp. C2-4-R8]
MRYLTNTLYGCITSLLAFGAAAGAAETGDAYLREIAGPVEARVIKVRDGDTIMVEAFIWPMQSVHVAVRLRGIDAPEHRGGCAAEKAAAQVATDRLKQLVGGGNVTLTVISGDKYFGRVLASLSASDGSDVADRLLREGLVARYEGGKRRDWCNGAVLGGLAPAAPGISGIG